MMFQLFLLYCALGVQHNEQKMLSFGEFEKDRELVALMMTYYASLEV